MLKKTLASWITVALAAGGLTPVLAPAAPPLNVIVVFADDISARELPLYGSTNWSPPEAGNSSDPAVRAQTPVLNQLAQEGMWVTQAWASTVCSPSRAMMMTGRFAHRHKWWTNRDIGVVQRPNGRRENWPLYESSPLHLGHLMQNAGYQTFWAGKTQMPGDLTRYGFHEGCFTPAGPRDHPNPYTDFRHEMRRDASGKRQLYNVDTGKPADTYLQLGWNFYPHVGLMNHPSNQGETFNWWPNTPESRASFGPATYGPDVELAFAFDFMERQHADGKPFFVYHTSHLGHDAFNWLNPEATSRWPGTPVITWDGTSYVRTETKITGDDGVYDTHGTVTEDGIHTHVNYLDYQMWLYRQKLTSMGIADNTVIVFTADNGTSGYGKHSSDRQRGTHVPLIIYAPGMTKQGRQDILVSLADFLPTLADLTGQALPADYDVDGESLWPYLMSDKTTHRAWVYGYKGAHQIVRGEHVMKDGPGKWYDVSNEPGDLISYPVIRDWSAASDAQRAERDRLTAAIAPFDLHATEHDAPGTPSAKANPKKPKKSKNKKK